MTEPRTQTECDRHNARRARAYAKAEALKAVADAAQARLETLRREFEAKRHPDHKDALARLEAHSVAVAARKAWRAAESRAEAIPYARLEISDEFGSL